MFSKVDFGGLKESQNSRLPLHPIAASIVMLSFVAFTVFLYKDLDREVGLLL